MPTPQINGTDPEAVNAYADQNASGAQPHKAIFDTLQRASFAGIEFPITQMTVKGGIRDHIHEYPHAAGGAPEKLGRKLYEVSMTADFQATFRGYPKLWPQGLIKLRALFEKQTTEALVIPTIGTIQAYCRNWTQQLEAKVRSGEQCTFEFIEDQASEDLAEGLTTTTDTLQAKFGTYQGAVLLADFAREADISIFDAISNAINGVLAYKDMAEAAGNLIGAKLLALADLCKQGDETLTGQNCKNFPMLNALHDIWDIANRGKEDLLRTQAVPRIYIVPSTMSMSDISTAIYGDTTHTNELAQLNTVDDVMRVKAGTPVTYVDSGTRIPGVGAHVTGSGTLVT